ncbi:hypothetical protein DL96DRAFT_1684280 [Flagelloscypha sp. PMI_526]|nr:hypothetical protein DL96DRAFT_1684280 [Flagelloscypha sp. PMI_526]
MRRSPHLPPELEQRIFFQAAEADRRKTLDALLLVARRVHEWLEPLLYRSLSLTPSSSFHKMTNLMQKSASFLSTTVVSVLLESTTGMDDWKWKYGLFLLKKTVGIQDLTLMGVTFMDDVFPVIPSYPRLRTLTLDHKAAFCFDKFLHGHPGLVFPALTHLEYSHGGILDPKKVQSQLPALSHVMVNFPFYFSSSLSTLLRDVPQFERVVLKYTSQEKFDDLNPHVGNALTPDDRRRVVQIVVADEPTEELWKKKTRENLSLWKIAEDEAKRDGLSE